MTTIRTTMLVPRSSPGSQELLAQRFTTWRAGRRRGERIPEELWQAAAEHARHDGLSATAARLKLSYYDLKRRLEAGGTARRSGSRGPVFVEVPVTPVAASGEERGTVELRSRDNAGSLVGRGAHFRLFSDRRRKGVARVVGQLELLVGIARAQRRRNPAGTLVGLPRPPSRARNDKSN